MPSIKLLYRMVERKLSSFRTRSGRTLLSLNVHPRIKFLGLKLVSLSNHYIPNQFSQEFEETFLTVVRQISPKDICISGTGAIVFMTRGDTYYLGASKLAHLSLRKSYYAWRSLKKTKLRTIIPSYWEATAPENLRLWRVEKLAKNNQLTARQSRNVLKLLCEYGCNSLLPRKVIERWKELLLAP